MMTHGDDEEQEEKGEKDNLLNREISIEIQSAKDDDTFTANDPPPILSGPNTCERLIRARKSLTRTQPIFETFDYPQDNDKSDTNGAESKVACGSPEDPERGEATSFDMNADSNDFTCAYHELSDGKEEEEEEDEVGPLDNLSASLSAIRMEKFALEKRRVSRILPRCLHRTFVDPNVEHLFQVYHERQRRADLPLLLINGILLAIYSCSLLCLEGVSATEQLPILIFVLLALVHIVFIGVLELKKIPEFGWFLAPYMIWLLCTAEVLILEVYNPYVLAPRQSFLWLLLLIFLCLAALPLRVLNACILSVLTAISYFFVAAFLKKSDYFVVQIISGLFLVTAAILIGLMSYFFADKKHRRAFLETRQSLEVKMIIEEQTKEQERLLLSVLPKHVAETMRQDMGRGGDGQFKKIYMSRHENVSILFADIVGFTAISSTYTASDLVKMLNELFARFDGLAEKYQQLRIKILGDCYYCISGAPKERPDHAILCVHMGLSMIEAIKYVRETTAASVDMRVGIHTGAVLAGVLGQRQWQFDVYSKDVVLANKMEASGKPGRVHVSNTTYKFLGEHFEVESAYGEKREDALRAASLKTYFISKVLIPHKPRPSLGMIKNGTQNNSSSLPSKEVPSDNTMVSRDSITLSTQEENKLKSITLEKNCSNPSTFTSKLQKELVSRDGRKDLLNKIYPLSLNFREQTNEASYRTHRETFSGAATTTLPLVVFFLGIANVSLFAGGGRALLIFFFGFVLVFCLTSVPAARSFPLPVCRGLLNVSDWIHATQFKRSLWFSILLTLTAATYMIDMYLCSEGLFPYSSSRGELLLMARNQSWNETQPFFISVKEDFDDLNLTTLNSGVNQQTFFYHSNHCPLPYFYSYFSLLVLLGASLLAQMNYILKMVILLIIAALQCFLNIALIPPTLKELLKGKEEDGSEGSISEGLLMSIELWLIALLLILLNRQTERTSRLLYLWQNEVEDQREHAEEIKQRNELLVYNILPPHVATHFMGIKKKKHEELYSQSYEEIGVLFASMPNFSDFYSEESVNNQGLECLRFLNEVISDFDGLLEKTQYSDIIKIKTIGSTYMAASGLNPTHQIKESDPIKARWGHLALLVDFAFELVRALQSINEQSFNHFVLRMGINHGPITAGVIGARKPHYDIWGNTVNVASRMESTGKAGCIQVTEETRNILRHFGYVFEQRGLIVVKGKGELMTYYLIGKGKTPQKEDDESSSNNQAQNCNLVPNGAT